MGLEATGRARNRNRFQAGALRRVAMGMLRRASSTAEAEGVGYRDGLKQRLRSAAELARHGTPLPASAVGVERAVASPPLDPPQCPLKRVLVFCLPRLFASTLTDVIASTRRAPYRGRTPNGIPGVTRHDLRSDRELH